MRRFKSLARFAQKASLIVAAILVVFLAVPQMTLADSGPFSSTQSETEACEGIDVGSGNPCSSDTSGTTLGGIVKDIINIMSIVLGAIAVIMIIIAGFKFVTSGGESAGVASARNMLIYALVGLVVAALAQVLVHFVLSDVVNGASNATQSSSSS